MTKHDYDMTIHDVFKDFWQDNWWQNMIGYYSWQDTIQDTTKLDKTGQDHDHLLTDGHLVKWHGVVVVVVVEMRICIETVKKDEKKNKKNFPQSSHVSCGI